MLQVIVIGNIGADCTYQGQQGREFISFRVAHTDRWKSEDGQAHEQTIWVDCTMNGRPAVAEFLKKGTTVAVIGTARLRVYSSEKDRCMKAGLQIAARSVELIGGKADPIPTRLYDTSGVMHNVQKFFHTDVQNAALLDQHGRPFNVDAAGWVTPVVTPTTAPAPTQQQQPTQQQPAQRQSAPQADHATPYAPTPQTAPNYDDQPPF